MEEEKMKIGIDIDEVVVEYVKHYLEFCEENLGRKFPLEEVSQYDIWVPLDISKEEVFGMARKFNQEWGEKNEKFVEGAKEAINVLSRNNELFFITSRHPEIKEKIIESFRGNFPNINFDIIFTEKRNGNEKTKAEVCKELGVDVLIEDRRKYAIDCARNGIKVLLMDQLWNRENCEHENITRVKNWDEIMEELEEMKNAKQN